MTPESIRQRIEPPKPSYVPQKVEHPATAEPAIAEEHPVHHAEPEHPKAPEVTHDKSDFSPMPVSKAAAGDDILTLWGNLLANIPSAPTRALLKQWAKPVKLSQDDVVITVKNEIYLTQFVSGSKKAVLQKAVDELLGQQNTKITVRLPQPGDEIPQGNVNIPKPKPAPAPQAREPENDEPKTVKEVDEAVDDSDAPEDESGVESVSEKPQRFEDMHSDTVNMVMDLFDGKVIE